MIGRLALVVLVAGCAPVAKAPTICSAGRVQDAVGKQTSDALVADALKRSGARTARRIGPDSAVTMDYRADRLDIAHDAAGVVTRISCG